MEEQLDIFNQYRYHLRYRNGSISKGYYTTFEGAAKDFIACKKSGYENLMDVLPVEIKNA